MRHSVRSRPAKGIGTHSPTAGSPQPVMARSVSVAFCPVVTTARQAGMRASRVSRSTSRTT